MIKKIIPITCSIEQKQRRRIKTIKHMCRNTSGDNRLILKRNNTCLEKFYLKASLNIFLSIHAASKIFQVFYLLMISLSESFELVSTCCFKKQYCLIWVFWTASTTLSPTSSDLARQLQNCDSQHNGWISTRKASRPGV